MGTLRESLLDDFGSQTKDLKRLQIKDWLEKNEASKAKFTINDDYTIDIDNFWYKGKGNFPDYIQFNKCRQDFIVTNCQMTTLRGCPKEVGESFKCEFNSLKTMKYCPEKIGKDLRCDWSLLKSLKGCPEHVFAFSCDDNGLTSLEGCPKQVDNYFSCKNNNLKNLKGCPEYIGGFFNCNGNPIDTLKYSPELVNGDFYCNDTNIKTFKDCKMRVKGDMEAINIDADPSKELSWVKSHIKPRHVRWY